jgi:hypothetical protein
MFYIKSDNIEELFREAAEKYQLDTTEAEAWDDVRAAVHENDTPPPPPDGKKKRRWFAFLWLLLIPLGWFAHNVWTNIREGAAPQNKTVQVAQMAVAKKEDHKTATPPTEANKPNNSLLTAVATAQGDNKTTNNGKPAVTVDGKSTAGTQGYAKMHVKQAGIAGAGFSANPSYTRQSNGSVVNNGKPTGTNPVAGGNTPVAEKNNDNGLNAGNSGSPAVDTKQAAPPLPVQDTNKNSQPVLNAAPEKNNSTADEKKVAAKQKSEGDNSHYFYVGLSAAPDVSFIHMQKTSTLGTGAGLVVGYHLNKNLSIETGALIEKKYYYTKGEYFNTSKIPYFVANNIHPTSATGNCNMIEIPLNLKYTFKANGNNHFYAIGGVSSYLMGHENYTFNYIDWGTPQQGTWGYNNKANYFFKVLNLGAGYERKLGAKTNLRIEPYLKLPLNGFGTGSLKIASTGLYFTLTRKIF